MLSLDIESLVKKFNNGDYSVLDTPEIGLFLDTNITATSTATNKEVITIQPTLMAGTENPLDHFGGGFLYVDTASNAQIDLFGEVHAGTVGSNGNVATAGNVVVTSKAVNTSIGGIVLKFPKAVVPDSGGSGGNNGNATDNGGSENNNNTNTTSLTSLNAANDTNTENNGENNSGGSDKPAAGSGAPFYAASIVINVQDTDAVINLGSKDTAVSDTAKITATGGLVATAASVNTLNSNAVIAEKNETSLATAINVGVSNGEANVNANTSLQGGMVKLDSQNLLNSLSMTTDSSIGVEPSGTDWLINLPVTRGGVQSVMDMIPLFKNSPKVEQAKDTNGQVQQQEWNTNFNIGVSLAVAVTDNKAITNVAKDVNIGSAKDLSILASTSVGDSIITTKNLFANMGKPEDNAVSSAIAVEVMENTAEVNIAEASSTDKGKLKGATGNVEIAATVDNSYNRVNKLIDDVESGWAAFLDHWAN